MENRTFAFDLKPFGEPGEKRDAVVVGLVEGMSEPGERIMALDSAAGGVIGTALAEGDFAGRAEQVLTLFSTKQTGPRRILLIGLGKAGELDDERVRRALAAGCMAAERLEIETLSLDIGSLAVAGPDLVRCAELAAETAQLALWRNLKYRSELKEEERPRIGKIELLWPGENVPAEATATVNHGIVTAGATCYARELIGRPGNELFPEALAEEAVKVAGSHGYSVKIFGADELKEMGFNALLSVGMGSARPPCLIVVDTAPESEEAPIALVGKGITFDTGGISIKPSKDMDAMKGDMAGAAAVLAAVDALGNLNYERRVVAVIPAAENMPGPSAQRPGDIWTSYQGITIEVLNTDAEGRLALADALAYAAKEYSPEVMIDLATLTGACFVALGDVAAGLLGNDNELCIQLEKAGAKTGERVWRLPLWPDYDEQLKSKIADIKNIGERGAGAITAAAFLKRFVGETRWTHIDIAGVSWLEKERAYMPVGPVGFGVRLLVETLTRRM
ncbi:MAG TPA: leucyl aminopeptidase [Acidobacteriota bacterium]|nr:leucyl aminopeptidase [Acidobacteriota bacterium]